MLRYLFLLFLFLSGCISSSKKLPDILVSIPPYQFLVEQIVQDAFTVSSIVPPKANSHLFEPSPSMLSSLISAKIWFQMGEPFEKKLLPVLKRLAPSLQEEDLRKPIFELRYPQDTSNISLEAMDPHIWMSPRLFAQQAIVVEKTLSQIYPEKQPFFKENLEQFLQKMEELNKRIQKILAFTKKRILLVSHPALGYFCEEYELIQLALEWEGKELSLKQLEALLYQMQQAKPALVITMPQHSNKGALKIAKELSLPVHEVDPYSEKYIAMLEQLAQNIAHP